MLYLAIPWCAAVFNCCCQNICRRYTCCFMKECPLYVVVWSLTVIRPVNRSMSCQDQAQHLNPAVSYSTALLYCPWKLAGWVSVHATERGAFWMCVYMLIRNIVHHNILICKWVMQSFYEARLKLFSWSVLILFLQHCLPDHTSSHVGDQTEARTQLFVGQSQTQLNCTLTCFTKQPLWQMQSPANPRPAATPHGPLHRHEHRAWRGHAAGGDRHSLPCSD